jgi:tetratricopeptide (TPR) repeat protein
MNLGNVLKALGRLDHAVTAYQTAAQLRPDGALALYNLGATHLARGDCAAALDALDRSLALSPGLALAHYNVGLCLQTLGDLGAAAAQPHRRAASVAAREGILRARICSCSWPATCNVSGRQSKWGAYVETREGRQRGRRLREACKY